MKKRLLSLVLLMAMSVTLFACGNSGGGSASKGSGDTTKVTIGLTAWPTNMFLYLADEQGFFKDNGLDVDIQEFSSTSESTNAFLGGKLDFCTFASSEVIAPFSRGADFKVVVETDSSNGSDGLVTKPEITTMEDLKGKTIATQLYSIDHMYLLTKLQESGMSQDDVNIVDMSIQESANAFIAGQVDAACIWEPYFSEAKNAGGHVLFSSADDPGMLSDVIGASGKIIESDPDAVMALVKSFEQAVQYWRDNPDEANAYMAEKLGVSTDDFKSQMDELNIPTVDEAVDAFKSKDGSNSWSGMQNNIRDFLYQLNVIDTNDFDCADLIDSQFIDALADE